MIKKKEVTFQEYLEIPDEEFIREMDRFEKELEEEEE